MNEPFRTNGLWFAAAQAGVDGIREVDRKSIIYVAGEAFSSAERWPNFNPAPFVKDPLNREVYEAHVYLDRDASGKYNDLASSESSRAVAERRLRPFIQWLKEHDKRGMIGEYGVPSNEPEWFDGMAAVLEIADRECLDTYVWAGGAWSPGYKLSLEPLGEVEKPLATWFRDRFSGAGARNP